MGKKIVIIIVSISLLKLTTSCWFRCTCSDPYIIDIAFNEINFNYDRYAIDYTIQDTIFPAKVGFITELLDTNFTSSHFIYYTQNKFSSFLPTFNGAYAWSCDCELERYKTQDIKSIEITTLYSFNENYGKNTDVTNLFLSYIDNWDQNKQLYSTLSEIIDFYNNRDLHDPRTMFRLLATEATTNDSCRFAITFHFEDNSCLCDTTEVIHIFQN